MKKLAFFVVSCVAIVVSLGTTSTPGFTTPTPGFTTPTPGFTTPTPGFTTPTETCPPVFPTPTASDLAPTGAGGTSEVMVFCGVIGCLGIAALAFAYGRPKGKRNL